MIAEPNDIGRVQRVAPEPPVAERGPTVLRMALGGQLRRLRKECGITRQAAGEAIRGSHAKISRLELGRTGFKERDIRDLLTLYGVEDTGEREVFLDLARRANQPGWWHRHGDLLPQWFENYLGLEQAASAIRTFEAHLVPGLLQTPDYARCVVTLEHHDGDAAERVAVRTRRQDILHRPNPATLWAVVDEAVLHRPLGGPQVMREQLNHLLKVAALPNVTLQVLPYDAGGHPAAGSSFSMLRFSEADLPDIVYIEQLTSALYLDRPQDLELYRSVMDQVCVQAASPDESMKRLAALAEQV